MKHGAYTKQENQKCLSSQWSNSFNPYPAKLWPRCIGLSQWARTLVLYLSSLLNPTILTPPRNASTPNADKTRHLFGNADRVLSFYLTAQCRNTEHVSKQSWL
jgi:hypothetical protein